MSTQPSLVSSGMGFSEFINYFKKLFPVLLIVGLLPVFSVFLIKPPSLSFFSNADESAELRVWIEPSDAVIASGAKVKLKLMANFSGGEKTIAILKVEAVGSAGLNISNQISALNSFNGQMVLGTVTVVADLPGNYNITIPETNIKINGFDDPLIIKTGTTRLTAK